VTEKCIKNLWVG